MRKKQFITALLLVTGMTTVPFPLYATNDGDNDMPEIVNLKKKPRKTEHDIPHSPAQYVTNLLGISDHTLYVYPTDEAQVVTITLKDENDSEVFTTTFLLAGATEQVTLPASLTGTYTLLYNIGGVTYMGSVDL